MIKDIKSWLKQRFSEPSSWVALSVLIKEVALRYPVIKVEGVCIEVTPEEKEEKDDSKETGTGKFI